MILGSGHAINLKSSENSQEQSHILALKMHFLPEKHTVKKLLSNDLLFLKALF